MSWRSLCERTFEILQPVIDVVWVGWLEVWESLGDELWEELLKCWLNGLRCGGTWLGLWGRGASGWRFTFLAPVQRLVQKPIGIYNVGVHVVVSEANGGGE